MLYDLVDKLDFIHEDLGLQLNDVKEDLQRARVIMDATPVGWKKKMMNNRKLIEGIPS